jgi:uncharacterized membrane protein
LTAPRRRQGTRAAGSWRIPPWRPALAGTQQLSAKGDDPAGGTDPAQGLHSAQRKDSARGDDPAPVTVRRGTRWPYVAALLLAVLYAVFFSWLGLRRYDAFLMHALDMGNMDQAVWNTLHGNLFHFTNMQQPIAKEAWGTTTRLSFHVEPILLPISLLYLIHASPQTLIVVQAAAVALGAPAACRLALRLTGSVALALAASMAYLLAPSLEAATLYEFHPVTLAAPALLWAIVCLEERRYGWFSLFALLAIACKEEIGLVIACLALWAWWRGAPRRFALGVAILGAGWSALAVGLIVPHFASGPSAYWQRYIDATTAGGKSSSGAVAVLRDWLRHPDKLLGNLFIWPKASMVNRALAACGYLSLAAWPLLAVSLPSIAIILLSTDQHMYGGLGQYSAELVPVSVAAAIYGCHALSRAAVARGLPGRWVIVGLALWIGFAALANQYVNGFTPIAKGYAAPVISEHDQLGQRLLRVIPNGAAVSSMDQLNPHLGDRAGSYLFPYIDDAGYVALDLTTNVNPGTPAEQYGVAMQLLRSRRWQILRADDGYLILRRTTSPLPAMPALPAAFYRFAVGPDHGSARPIASFGPDLQLLGATIERREQVNLRVPDAILTTRWRVLRPLPAGTTLEETVGSAGHGTFYRLEDRAATDWRPMDTWQPGQVYTVRSIQISFLDTSPETDAIGLVVRTVDAQGQARPFAPRLPVVHNNSDCVVVGSVLQVARVTVAF